MYVFFRTAFTILFVLCFILRADALENFSFGDPMIDAAEKGNDYVVANLLKNKKSPNIKGKFGVTPLMRASINGHHQTVKLLLEGGANPNFQDFGGATAMHLAARVGRADIVELLAIYGASSDIKDMESFTPLMRAVNQGDAKSVQVMVKRGANLDILNKYSSSARQMIHNSNKKHLIDIIDVSERPAKVKKVHKSKIDDEDKATIKENILGDKKDLEGKNKKESLGKTAYKERIVSADLVKDLNSYIKDPKESIVKEEFFEEDDGEDEVIEALLSVDSDKIKVVEAIKLPNNLDMNDPKNKLDVNNTVKNLNDSLGVSKESSFSYTTDISYADDKEYWMEISGFDAESDALNFWQKASRDYSFKGLKAKLLEQDGPNMKKALRFGKFKNSGDVFSKCKIAKKLNSKVMCYVVNGSN